MVITFIGYLLLALSVLAVLTFCCLTASCFKLRTRSSHSGTGSLTTTVGTGHQKYQATPTHALDDLSTSGT